MKTIKIANRENQEFEVIREYKLFWLIKLDDNEREKYSLSLKHSTQNCRVALTKGSERWCKVAAKYLEKHFEYQINKLQENEFTPVHWGTVKEEIKLLQNGVISKAKDYYKCQDFMILKYTNIPAKYL